MLSNQELKEWEKKRKSTVIGYLFVSLIVGTDHSAMAVLLYSYFKNTMAFAEFYYGLANALYYVSATVVGLVISRYIDRTRKIKETILLFMSVHFFGNILYLMAPYSVIYPIVGRILAGANETNRDIFTAEVTRIFDEKESTKMQWKLAAAYSLGFVVGPMLNVLFKKTNIQLDIFFINEHNINVLYVNGLILLGIAACFILVHNCSQEVDFGECHNNKNHFPETMENLITNEGSEIGASLTNASALNAIKCLCLDSNIRMILVWTFVLTYVMMIVDLTIPLVLINIVQWNLFTINVFFWLHGLGYFFTLTWSSDHCVTGRRIYKTFVFCIICLMLNFVFFFTLNVLERDLYRDFLFVSLLLFAYTFIWIIDDVILKEMLTKLVPSSIQNFSQSFRFGVCLVGDTLASLSTPLLLPYLTECSIVAIAVISLMLVITLRSSRHFQRIQEVRDFEM